MKYQGICSKIGGGNSVLGAFFGPVAITNTIEIIQAAQFSSLSQNMIALIAGSLGFSLAAGIHDHALNPILSKIKTAPEKGGNIVRKAQATFYAIPVTLALSFNAIADPQMYEILKQNTDKQNITYNIPVQNP